MKIAIIGAGCSGVMAALHILRKNAECQVDLFEGQEKVGTGIAYGANFDEWLLNVASAAMGIWHDKHEDFLAWLNKNGEQSDKYSFKSRRLYGHYLQDCLSKFLEAEKDRFKLIKDEITDLRNDSGKYKLTGSKPHSLDYDLVVLAVGNQTPDLPLQLQKISENNVLSNPWDGNKLENISGCKSIFILGAGLTAIDVILRLSKSNPESKFHVLSRSGIFPMAHSDSPLSIPDLKEEKFLFNSDLNHIFSASIKYVRDNLNGDWRIFVDALRPHSNTIWHNFSEKERKRFARHLKSRWERVRHRFAPEIGRALCALQEVDRIHLIAGRLGSVATDGQSLKVTVHPKSRIEKIFEVDALINCIGLGSMLKVRNKLLNNLINNKMISVDYFGWGLKINSENMLIDGDNNAQESLFLVGPLSRGSVFESTAVREIRAQADRIAELISNKSI